MTYSYWNDDKVAFRQDMRKMQMKALDAAAKTDGEVRDAWLHAANVCQERITASLKAVAAQ